MSESIIGKRVYLQDNSHQITVGTNENPYLAGTNGYVMGIKEEPTPVTIVSEPFDLCLEQCKDSIKQQTIKCIYVKTDDGNFHRAINDWREISPKEREFNNTPQTDAIDWNETNVAQMRDQMRNFCNAMVERNNSIDEKIATLDKQVAEYTASTAGYTSNQLFLNRIKTLEEKFGDFSKWEEGTTVIDFVTALYNVKEEKILELSKQMLARVDRIDAKIESQSKVIQVLNEEVQRLSKESESHTTHTKELNSRIDGLNVEKLCFQSQINDIRDELNRNNIKVPNVKFEPKVPFKVGIVRDIRALSEKIQFVGSWDECCKYMNERPEQRCLSAMMHEYIGDIPQIQSKVPSKVWLVKREDNGRIIGAFATELIAMNHAQHNACTT